MKTRTTLVAVGLAVAIALPGSASLAQASTARSLASTTVTIKAEGTDLSGKVKSVRQACITDRKVIVIKVVGTRGGGDDMKFASDTASSDGSGAPAPQGRRASSTPRSRRQ